MPVTICCSPTRSSLPSLSRSAYAHRRSSWLGPCPHGVVCREGEVAVVRIRSSPLVSRRSFRSLRACVVSLLCCAAAKTACNPDRSTALGYPCYEDVLVAIVSNPRREHSAPVGRQPHRKLATSLKMTSPFSSLRCSAAGVDIVVIAKALLRESRRLAWSCSPLIFFARAQVAGQHVHL